MLTSLIIVALVLTLVCSSVDQQRNHLVKLSSVLDMADTKGTLKMNNKHKDDDTRSTTSRGGARTSQAGCTTR